METMVTPNPKFWNGKKVFITGHTGFKGSWLSKTLLSFGTDVSGYALEPPTNPNLYNLIGLDKEINSSHGDIRDISKLEQVIRQTKPEIVFHLAAQPLVRESYLDPVNTYETNVIGTVNLLETLRKVDSVKSIVNVTTDKVYLNLEKDTGYTEDEVLCGTDPYSNSKSCSELVTFSYRNSFFSGPNSPALSTARSGNVIGGGDFAKDRIIPDCIRAAIAQTPIQVRNPHSIRPYQHVLECISGYLLLAELQYLDKQKYEGAYNFGPNAIDDLPTSGLVELFCNTWNELLHPDLPLSWNFQPDGSGLHEATYLRLNNVKAKEKLKWEPKMNINDAIENTVNWAIKYLNNEDPSSVIDDQIKAHFSVSIR